MTIHPLSYQSTNAFGKLFLDYISGNKTLHPFYNQLPEEANFISATSKRQFDTSKREVLVSVLKNQYKNLQVSAATQANINSLQNNNTFTITTGHQLCLAGGPLYFIYKIISAISASQRLNTTQKDFHFVPVFWMASEDHDFEEINHFYLFGKKQEWKSEQKGAVGRFGLQDLQPLLEEIKELPDFIKQAYLTEKNLADATRSWVNTLFGEYGLVILDADNAELKKQFTDIISSDIFEQKAFELVNQTSEELVKYGYSAQVNPREINFFYLDNQFRERIIQDGENYKVNNTELKFSKEELKKILNDSPEKFSPNVVFRPLYQECILPNISYIGGPGELAYWLQLKTTFINYNIPFPLLQPRNFYLYIPENLNKKIEKFGYTHEELFAETSFLKEKYKKENDLKVSLEHEKAELNKIYSELKEKIKKTDPTLEATVLAEMQKAQSGLEIIAKKTDKAIDQKNEQAISQINTIKEKLFPEGNLQERHDNFLNIYSNNPAFISELLEKNNPFGYTMNIIRN